MIAQIPTRQLERELYRRSYYYFFRDFWGELEGNALADNWHIRYLCDELQAVGEKVIRGEDFDYNLIINISPGESKSSIGTVFFNAWLWINNPALNVFSCSYEGKLAMSHSVKTRDLIRSAKFQELFGDDFQLRRDMDAKSEYGILYGEGQSRGGTRYSAGVGGSVTGRHFHIIIVDDPLDPMGARSDAERESANLFMTETLRSRKFDEAKTPTILIMQRLHENDPTGYMVKKWAKTGQLKHIRLPADDRYEISPPELSEYYVDQDGGLRVMNPMRKPEKVVRAAESDMTSEGFSGQYGQDPQPAEGNKIKKVWLSQRFRVFELEHPAGIENREIIWNATLDGAYTKQKKNSATALLIWTIHQGKLYLRDYREWWLEFPDMVDAVVSTLSGLFSPRSTLYVEPKATGKSLVQTMRKIGGINIVEDELPKGLTNDLGKEQRVDRATPYMRGMNVLLNDAVDWERFINQCATFPNASHSDLVDTLTMAIEKVDYNTHLADKNLW